METKQKLIDRKAAFWTAVTVAILLLLLIILGIKTMPQEEESGMLINFGNSETGMGQVEPAKNNPAVSSTPPPPPPPIDNSSNAQEEIETQNFEEAAAIAAEKKKQEQKRKEELERKREEERRLEAERQKQREEEQKRLEEERKKEAERKAKEAKAEAIRQQMSNAFGKTQNESEGQGITGTSGNQGATHGDLNSNNYSGNGLGTSGNWSLAGRSLVGSLPKPQYTVQEEGIVVVEIYVDRNGRVISATPILRGSTTQDTQLWALAKEAALKAKFNANPGAQSKQVGTITYNFVLN